MSGGFSNAVVGGQGTLIRSAIHSPDFVTGVSGWSINKDGTAEFNNVVIRGQLQVQDGSGNTIAGIDSLGNITGEIVSASTDMNIAGLSLLNDYFPDFSQGTLFRTSILGSQSLPVPASPTSSEVVLFELDCDIVGGRDYGFHIGPIRVNLSGAGLAHLTIYYTNDGTTPTTASGVWSKVIEVTSGTNANQPITLQTHNEYSPLLSKTYRFIVAIKTGGTGSGTPTWQIQTSPDNGIAFGTFWIEDLGISVPDTGFWIGSGVSGSGGGTPRNFTKTYSATDTWSYEGTNADSSPNPGFSPGGLINHNGNAMQGDDQLGDNGNTSTWIRWPSAVATDVAGATITSIKLQLNNNHSWFNSGMTVAIGKSTSGGGGGSRPAISDPDLVEGFVSEGATKTFGLNSQLTAFANALVNGNQFVLYHAGSSRNFYGFFAGGSSPKLTVSYTK